MLAGKKANKFKMVLAAVVMTAALLTVVGCASSSTTAFTYHHHDLKDNSFWMTATTRNNRTDQRDVESLWHCQNGGGGPVCTQATFIECPAGSQCEFVVSHIGEEKYVTECGSMSVQSNTPASNK